MASPRTVPQAAAPVLVPGTVRPCPPPLILDTQSPQLHLSYYSLSVTLYPLCIAVPPIPRPSDKQNSPSTSAPPAPPGRCSRSIFDNFTHLPKRPQPLALFPDPPNRHFGIKFLGTKTMVRKTSPRPHQLRLSRFRLLPLLLLLQNPVYTKPLLLFLVCYTVPFVYSCPAHSPTIRRTVY